MTFLAEIAKPIAPILNMMEIGDSEVYPITKYNSIKGTISRISIMTDKRFSSNISRQDRSITVTRIQ
jgi:hypothetical protein